MRYTFSSSQSPFSPRDEPFWLADYTPESQFIQDNFYGFRVESFEFGISSSVFNQLCYNSAMKLSQIGEFGLINRLNRQIISATEKRWRSSQELIIGIGDDAAVWKPQNPFQIITTDALIEGVHFSLKTSTWNELGWKSVAVNLSDIAAMGGIPMYALVSLGLPKDILVENI